MGVGFYGGGSGSGGSGTVPPNVATMISKTTAEWDNYANVASTENTIYIYTDYGTKEIDGSSVLVSNMKIGDGVTTIGNLPFLHQSQMSVIQSITEENVESWNNKVSATVDSDDPENLTFFTTLG